MPDEGSVKSGRGPGRGLELAAMRHVMRLQQESLSQLMNGPIRQKLGDIPTDVTWGGACIYTLFDGDLISAQYTCIVYLMQNVFFSAGCMIVCVSLIVCMYVCMYVCMLWGYRMVSFLWQCTHLRSIIWTHRDVVCNYVVIWKISLWCNALPESCYSHI